MVENVFEELDSPREYFFNQSDNKLFYFPPKGLDLSTAKVEITVLKHLVEIIGSEPNPVKHVNISGINFSQTQRTFMEQYHKLLRSDWAMYRGGAILIENTENVEINNCELKNLGGNGIFVNRYNRNIIITNNHFPIPVYHIRSSNRKTVKNFSIRVPKSISPPRVKRSMIPGF